jgi:HK97 family phage portal protein
MANPIGNFFNSIGKLFGSSNEYYKTRHLGVNAGQLTGMPEFITITNDNAYDIMKTTSELDAVIGRRGRMLSTGKWMHEKSDASGNITVVENSEYVRLLENPNPLMKGNDLLMQYNENLCLYGNNYEYVLRAFTNSIPSGLSNLQVNTVEIKATGKSYKQSKIEDIIEYYTITNGTVKDVVSTEEINHTRIVNSNNPIVGESPLKALYMDISNIRGAKKFRNVIITKEGALGILSNKTSDAIGATQVTDEDRSQFDKAYTEGYGLADGKKRVIITDANLKWEATSFPTKQMMLFEEVDAGTAKIIDAFGMDENIFSTKSTYENKVQALRGVYQMTIVPMSEEISMNRTAVFGMDGKTEWVRLDYSHIPVLQENLIEQADVKKTKAETIASLVGSGMTLAEAVLTSNLED